MEEFCGGLFVGIFIAVFAALIAYGAAKSTMQEQAVAAQVACWKVDTEGKRSFVWNCKGI